ncbi:DUF2306 domain-containing protein [Aurantiacibacter aquimixticola]|uniref:DUF2306 domain-containing protein n=1 Tax=Aurantiacibacter aquimixticola TaxID=1958945 RepID=A0A419RR47_9SPHN|nr:DUF2306 domain-containing protein [Aurantiacibacter aquimixticola]RJY08260.1 DUF2306 domain-containing protein [Aurantiacibacter aquimixticola]
MINDLSPLLLIHFLSASYAILAGAAIFLMRKGTQTHRVIGTSYIAAMFVTVLSVVPVPATVMPFFGTRFGFFHIFVVVGFISLLFGIRALRRWHTTRDLEWLRAHQIHLAYSYAGLLMAGFSQMATNPRWLVVAPFETMTQFWIAFAAVNAGIYAVAIWLIQTRIAKGDPMRWKRTRG